MIRSLKRKFYKILRTIILKSLSEKYGKEVFCRIDASRKLIHDAYPEIEILKYSGIHIVFDRKTNVKEGKDVKLYSPYHIDDCSIGDYTYIAQNPYISMTTIGKFCSIGPNLVCGWGIHPLNGISTHPMFFSTMKQNGMTLSAENKVEERKPITIGNDVFIGANVTILDGVSIGDGAVIGAGAVVSKDIPPYAVAVGCPIRILKYRFPEDLCKRLRQIEWWNFDLEHLKDVEANLFSVNDFLDKYGKAEVI